MSVRFQGFVAWRYLMARPRKISVPIAAFTLVSLLAAVAIVAVAYLRFEPTEVLERRLMFTGGSAIPREQILLYAAIALAVGQFWLMVGIIRYFFTFFTTVSIVGVFLGTMVLVVVLSVMSGFETDLRDKILGSNAHILVTKDDGEFTEYHDVAAEIAAVPGVVAHMPYATSEVVIAANKNYQNVIIKGIEPGQVGKVTKLEENLLEPGALEKLWPLDEDGEVVGPPADAGPAAPVADAGPGGPTAVDPAPDDFGADIIDPIDFSGGEEPPALPENWGEPVDPAPEDFGADTIEPMDFSGGAEPGELPEDWSEADPGAVAAGPDGRDGGIGEDDDAIPADPDLEDLEVDTAPGIFELGQELGEPPFPPDGDMPPPPPGIPPRVAQLSGVLVGSELVKTLHLYVGQEVRMVSPLSDPTNPGGAPVPYTRNYRVAGTFYTGMYEYDLKFVYVELESLQAFLDLGDQVNGIEVRVADPDVTGPVKAALQKRLGAGYRVQDWKELNRNLFSALKLEKIAMFLVLAIIILVASFSIVGNLIMMVVEKAKEIALIKTLGATDRAVMQIFVAQGLLIGAVGTLIGVAHGLAACILAKNFGIPINADVYYIDELPINVEPATIVAIAAAGLIISVVATAYPALMGARLRPLEGLRYE